MRAVENSLIAAKIKMKAGDGKDPTQLAGTRITVDYEKSVAGFPVLSLTEK